MKKLLIALLTVLFPMSAFAKASYIENQLKDVKNNVEYNTVKKYKRSYQTLNLKTRNITDLKDPKLITLPEYEKIADKTYNAKLAKDDEFYKKLQSKIKATNDVDYYNVYRISERLVRANNLDYVNWRIAIRKTVDKVNAESSNGNFVCIYTPLYDSLESNDDALAFVLAHEMAHLILGHGQRQLNSAMSYFSDNIISYSKAMKDSRTMEYMADAEAFILLYKAGYSPQKALDALYILDAIPNVNSAFSSHPVTKKRIQSALENIAVLNPNWIDEGRKNIYNSAVLPAKKSSDRVSFIINKSTYSKDFYQPENYEQRLTRIAYLSYLNGDMENADRLFEKLAKYTGKYEHYLYLSYAEQYLFNFTKKKQYLKKSLDAVNKALEINPNNKFVTEQLKEIEELEKYL